MQSSDRERIKSVWRVNTPNKTQNWREKPSLRITKFKPKSDQNGTKTVPGMRITSMRVSKSRRAASRTGCLPSPRRSTTAGTRPLKCNLKWSPERTAADARAWREPWETLKLLSLRRSKQQSTREVTSAEERAFLEDSRRWWRRSTPAIRSFVSLARASSRASSIAWI